MRQPKCRLLATLGCWRKMTFTSCSVLASCDRVARASAVLLPPPSPPGSAKQKYRLRLRAKSASSATSSKPPRPPPPTPPAPPPPPPRRARGRAGHGRTQAAIGRHHAQAPGPLGHQKAPIGQKRHGPGVLQAGGHGDRGQRRGIGSVSGYSPQGTRRQISYYKDSFQRFTRLPWSPFFLIFHP